MRYNLRLNRFYIAKIARDNGWEMVSEERSKCMLVFYRNNVRMAVFYNTNSVFTEMNHPRKGHSKLWRRKINLKMMEKIFINPRHHTQVGIHAKNSTNLIDDEQIKVAQNVIKKRKEGGEKK